jgi:phage repressor protein C with HTH and peptisase S24 domain
MDKGFKKVRLIEMLPIITEKISSGGEVSIPITGKSMYPTLKQGRDYAVLKKAPEHLEKGDIPFYRRENGCFVLHRVVGEDENGYILCGDNQSEKEFGIKHSQIIAVLTAVERNGKRIPIDSVVLLPENRFHNQVYLVRRIGSRVKRLFRKKENGKKD